MTLGLGCCAGLACAVSITVIIGAQGGLRAWGFVGACRVCKRVL